MDRYPDPTNERQAALMKGNVEDEKKNIDLLTGIVLRI